MHAKSHIGLKSTVFPDGATVDVCKEMGQEKGDILSDGNSCSPQHASTSTVLQSNIVSNKANAGVDKEVKLRRLSATTVQRNPAIVSPVTDFSTLSPSRDTTPGMNHFSSLCKYKL